MLYPIGSCKYTRMVFFFSKHILARKQYIQLYTYFTILLYLDLKIRFTKTIIPRRDSLKGYRNQE